MSSLFDDAMMGAKYASIFIKGAKKVGKLAADGIQKANESEKFHNLKADIQNRVSNSDTLNMVKNEVQQRFTQFAGKQTASAQRFCQQCNAALPGDARFCSHCGAKQEPLYTQEEDIPVESDDAEVRPTVLKNDLEEIPDLFDFQPARGTENHMPREKR